MLRVRGQRHSSRELHPNGEGSSHLGQRGSIAIAGPGGRERGEIGCPADPGLEPPPGAPIRTAWIAGRIGLAFVDEQAHQGKIPGEAHQVFSLESLEALDVEERPYIWDL